MQMRVWVGCSWQVLAAESAETLDSWREKLEDSVRRHTPAEAVEAKAEAARLLRPLILAQMHSEGESMQGASSG